MPAVAPQDVSARLLVIDNGRELAEIAAKRPDSFDVRHVADGRDGVSALQTASYDVVLADLESLGDAAEDPTHAVSRLARLGGAALLVVVSSTDSVTAAVEALQAGAHDCLARPFSADDLIARIAVLRARHDRRGLPPPLTRAPLSGPGRLVAHAPQMQVVLDQLNRIAASPAPVFITGEGGTGKRLVAETLHALGPSAARPFVAVNCAATVPLTGLAAEEDALAHLAGPDGAESLIRGGGGTLYLHEIGVLGPAAQARLLTLIEPGGATIAGDGSAPPLSLRIVCSSRRNPVTLVNEKALRQDLFYRLNVLPLHLPPLRQRPEDIAPLATHFLKAFARAAGRPLVRFTPSALAYLDAHDWPGNVRQLENLMRRVVTMFAGNTVTPQMLAAADIEGQAGSARAIAAVHDAEDEILPMWQQEQRIIETAIARCGGNIAKAAAALEISPSTIYRKKQAWEERNGDIAGAA